MSDSEVQLYAFYVGERQYAVDLHRVDEILQPVEASPLPHAPPFIDGVIHMRGTRVPVVDLRRRLGAQAPARRVKPKLVIVRLGGRHVALRVDGVADVIRVRKNELRPAAEPFVRGGHPVIGVCGPPDRLTLLLDLKAALRP